MQPPYDAARETLPAAADEVRVHAFDSHGVKLIPHDRSTYAPDTPDPLPIDELHFDQVYLIYEDGDAEAF